MILAHAHPSAFRAPCFVLRVPTSRADWLALGRLVRSWDAHRGYVRVVMLETTEDGGTRTVVVMTPRTPRAALDDLVSLTAAYGEADVQAWRSNPYAAPQGDEPARRGADA